jgi:hypothetical protein
VRIAKACAEKVFGVFKGAVNIDVPETDWKEIYNTSVLLTSFEQILILISAEYSGLKIL